jgi:hypothetical protein
VIATHLASDQIGVAGEILGGAEGEFIVRGRSKTLNAHFRDLAGHRKVNVMVRPGLRWRPACGAVELPP